MCVEGESPTTNNFLNTKAKALSCNEFNEPNGSLSIPVPYIDQALLLAVRSTAKSQLSEM